jgi:hypothetical protein
VSNIGLLTTEEDFPSILMYWASVILTARICKPSVARFVIVCSHCMYVILFEQSCVLYNARICRR